MAGTEISYIDEYGNILEDIPDSSEGVTSIDELEGDYAALLKEIDLSSINEELTVDYYEEGEGSANLDLLIDNDVNRILTMEVIVGLGNYYSTMEEFSEEFISGIQSQYEEIDVEMIDFDEDEFILLISTLAEPGEYDAYIELLRVFNKDGDIFSITYKDMYKEEMDKEIVNIENFLNINIFPP
ncbi:hypothetical protein [Oceanobacillus sp. FSL K6-0251]|uniref:hypothetical protein n=1 Tax=Oceanobacillus sp. FSL K6-0251 TaxID=2921602 RepID=UPI0030F793EA